VRKREFEVLGDQLLDVRSLDVVLVGDFNDFENVNAPESSTMSRGHILVEGLGGIGAAHLTVLLVHVVCAGAGVVTDPDAKVLDLEGSLLVDDVQGDDLAVGLLDLAQLHEEVPEAGLGNHGVGCEDSHAVEFRGRVGVCRKVAPDDLVFLKATHLDCILIDCGVFVDVVESSK